MELKRDKQSYVMKHTAEPTEVFLQCNLGREMKSRPKKKIENELAKNFVREHYSICWNRTNFLANPIYQGLEVAVFLPLGERGFEEELSETI